MPQGLPGTTLKHITTLMWISTSSSADDTRMAISGEADSIFSDAEDASQAVVDGLKERGVPVRTYENGNQQDRMDIISNATEEMGLRFRTVEITPEVRKENDDIRFRVEFTPSEIASMETPILSSKGTFKNLGEAEKWAMQNLSGRGETNVFTRELVTISRKSIREMLAPKFSKKVGEEVHMSALMSVLDFIKTGIPAEVHPDTHGKGFDVIRLYNAFSNNEKIYRVKSTIKRLKEGDRYYTYEMQEMELIEDMQNALGLNSNPVLNSTDSISGPKLLKGVK